MVLSHASLYVQFDLLLMKSLFKDINFGLAKPKLGKN